MDNGRVNSATVDELLGPSRKSHIVKARSRVIYGLWRYSDLSLKEIGCLFGGRTPATIHHAIQSYLEMEKEEANG